MTLPIFPIDGGCQCRAVRYQIAAPPLTVYNCHCRDCQRSSGGTHSMSMPTLREHVVVLQGELVAYDKTADSGRILRWMACSRCRTRVWVEKLSAPHLLMVKPGTLDDMSWAVPVGNIWTASKAPWVQIDEALVNFPGQPERHADRVVADMLRFIAAEHAGTLQRVGAAIRDMNAGNPKAQARMVKRIRRVAGANLIDISLTPGKRGHYRIALYDWVAWDNDRGDEIKPGDQIPAKPWLICAVTGIQGGGSGARQADSCFVLHITHHALSRLAQRCGARTIEDVITAAKALWRSYYAYRMTMPLGVPTPDGFRLMVEFPGHMGNAIAVTRPHEKGGLLIVTIIEAE